MRAARRRWALSFADLCLLLLGFFIVLQARPDRARLAAGLRGAMGGHDARQIDAAADPLFEPDEALLNARGRTFATDVARRAGTAAITIESRGIARATGRFDGWELAAARTAALARALAAGGVRPDRISLDLVGAATQGQGFVLRLG